MREHRRDPVYHRLALFMVLTGTRVSEACGMCWDAVDLEQGIVRIVRTVRWDHWTRRLSLEETTKTPESARMFPLAETLRTMLREMQNEHAATPAKLVFPAPNGQPLRYNAVQSAFNAGFKALDLPWRSTHICRHTFGTLALLATRDLSAVQASLGHKSRQITEKYAKSVALLSASTSEKTAELLRESHANHVQNHVLTAKEKA